MKLSKGQVKHAAKLANLPITDQEEEILTPQLSQILDYIDQLNRATIDLVEPTFNVINNINVTRPDTTSQSLTQEEALANASGPKKGFFVTKGIFEES